MSSTRLNTNLKDFNNFLLDDWVDGMNISFSCVQFNLNASKPSEHPPSGEKCLKA